MYVTNYLLDPACLDINTDRRCYTLDPLCSPERSSSTNCTCNDTPVVILAILLFFSFIIIGVCLWKILQRKGLFIFFQKIVLEIEKKLLIKKENVTTSILYIHLLILRE